MNSSKKSLLCSLTLFAALWVPAAAQAEAPILTWKLPSSSFLITQQRVQKNKLACQLHPKIRPGTMQGAGKKQRFLPLSKASKHYNSSMQACRNILKSPIGCRVAANSIGINSEQQLRSISDARANYHLQRDIVLTSPLEVLLGGRRFEGTFNGCDKTIANVVLSNESNVLLGMFSGLAARAVVKNLKLVNVRLEGHETTLYAGVVTAGNAGTIERVAILNGSLTAQNANIGALVGLQLAGGVMSECSSQAVINAPGIRSARQLIGVQR